MDLIKTEIAKINDSVHPTVLSSSQNHAMSVKHNGFPVEPSGCRRVFQILPSGLDEKEKKGRTAVDSVQSGRLAELWHAAKAKQSSRAGAAK
ncbi:hypothetical protein TNCV_1397841 [Trichonephila clavipes]|nr:hypothetical protein TNCV_1397841 [Trichonephila clavipes]